MDFNQKLQKLRKDQNLSQEQLAEKLLVSRQAISKWESGTTLPDLNNLIRLSELFDVSLDYLVKDVEEDKSIGWQNESPPDRLKITTAGSALGLAIGLLTGKWWLIFVGALVFFAIGAILSALGIIDKEER